MHSRTHSAWGQWTTQNQLLVLRPKRFKSAFRIPNTLPPHSPFNPTQGLLQSLPFASDDTDRGECLFMSPFPGTSARCESPR